jgi:hypothetical protein
LLARVIEYDVRDREGNGTGELIVLLTNARLSICRRCRVQSAATHAVSLPRCPTHPWHHVAHWP